MIFLLSKLIYQSFLKVYGKKGKKMKKFNDYINESTISEDAIYDVISKKEVDYYYNAIKEMYTDLDKIIEDYEKYLSPFLKVIDKTNERGYASYRKQISDQYRELVDTSLLLKGLTKIIDPSKR